MIKFTTGSSFEIAGRDKFIKLKNILRREIL